MPRKLAITISGAVSLGSYESGVAFEVLDALKQHNQWAAANSPGDRIEIDVLTGASAGGMTVAMIARQLLYNGAGMNDPYNNPLYNAWVQDIDIVGLLARGQDEDPAFSVLSSDCVIGISQKYLTDAIADPSGPHPALSSGNGGLQLGLALSNLQGVDYLRPTRSGGQFVYTDHQDQHLFALQSAGGAQAAQWETIRATAVACGAFPFAFRVQDLLRNIADYPSPFLSPALRQGPSPRYFTYTDGGVFQNQPLGMAKNLVDHLPDAHVNPDRGYLFIAPQPLASASVPYTTDPNDKTTAFGAAKANYFAVAGRLVESIMGQSEFQDWIVAEQVNDAIAFLDKRATQLQAMFAHGTLTAAQAGPVSTAILAAFFADGGAMTPASQSNLDAARAQLRTQYASEYAALGAGSATADAWIDAVLVLELAAGLHEKDDMLIYDFVAEDNMLAGAGAEWFEGFFDVRYRKHDYDYGRSIGQRQLLLYQAQAGSIFAGLHWTPRPIDQVDPTLNVVDMSTVDRDKRQQVYDHLSSAADDLLEEAGANLITREAIKAFFLDGQLKKFLAL